MRSLIAKTFLGAWIVFTAAVVVLALIPAVLAAYEWTLRTLDPGTPALKRNCSRCHSPGRVYRYAMSPDEWRKTVTQMLAKPTASPAAEADIEAIQNLLERRRSMNPESAFRFRCGRCHSRGIVNDYASLSGEALGLLVEKHVLEKNNAVYAWEGKIAAQYIMDRFHAPQPGAAPVQALFERDCNVCHTITFRYKTMFETRRDNAQWAAVIERMRVKAPSLIREDDIPALLAHVLKMRDTGKIAP